MVRFRRSESPDGIAARELGDLHKTMNDLAAKL